MHAAVVRQVQLSTTTSAQVVWSVLLFTWSRMVHCIAHTRTYTVYMMVLQSELPQEVGSSGVRSAPWNIKLSPNLGHLAINYKGGAVIVYRIRLPPPPAHLAATADLFAAMSLTSWGETKLQMLVHLSMKHVEGRTHEVV